MNSDARVLRGLSIATLIFCILGVLAGGAFLALMISASSMLSDPAFFDLFAQELQSTSSGSAAFDGSSPATTYDYSSMSDQELRDAATLGMNIVIGLAAGYMVLHAVGIVSSIMTMRAIDTPEKLGRAFGWTVAAAVCSAVVFSIITCVCFIIAAWMNSRVRKNFAAYKNTYPGAMYQGGMPVQPGQGAGYNQGTYKQGAPYGQGVVPPQQPVPGQPMPQQPVQPQSQPQQQPVGQSPAPTAQPAQPQQQMPAPAAQPQSAQQPTEQQPAQSAPVAQQPVEQSGQSADSSNEAKTEK